MNSNESLTKSKIEQATLSPPLTRPFTLENWRVMPELNRLQNQQDGQQRSIEPRLMHLLCYLAANQFVVLERDLLVDLLWPNVIVNENSLTRAVSELRKQLKDGCSANAIETIPKRGYRLSCAALDLNCTAESPQNQPWLNESFMARMAANNRISIPLSKTPLLTLAASALIAATISFNFGDSREPLTAFRTAIVDEIVMDEPGYWGGELALSAAKASGADQNTSSKPVVSHDGSSYAYVDYTRQGSTIYVGTLDELSDPYPVFHTAEKLVNLAWSPVGQSLLFTESSNLTTAALFSNSQTKSQLLILDVGSGKLQRLVKDDLPVNSSAVGEANLT